MASTNQEAQTELLLHNNNLNEIPIPGSQNLSNQDQLMTPLNEDYGEKELRRKENEYFLPKFIDSF